jgi:hypothetical protein
VHVAGSRWFWRSCAGRTVVLLALLASATNMAMGTAGASTYHDAATVRAAAVRAEAGAGTAATPASHSDHDGQRSGSPFRLIHKARGVVTPYVVLSVPVTGVPGPAGAPVRTLGDTAAAPGAPPVSDNPHRGPPRSADFRSAHRRTSHGL